MNDEDMERIGNNVREAQLNNMQNQIAMQQQDILRDDQEKSMLKEQLDLGEDLERIDYLLRGYTIERDDNGVSRWVRPNNNDMIVLSDYGVQLVRDNIAWYINKNTLLSNYEEDVILEKMEDFANDLNDDVFMNYEKVFKYPTLEECKQEIRDRIKKRVDIQEFALQLLGHKTDRKEIEQNILKEMEGRIVREFNIIKEQKMKDKLKRFAMLIRKVQDAVHSTYLRAWKGQERTSLRKHMHVTENKGGMSMQERDEKRGLSIFSRK